MGKIHGVTYVFYLECFAKCLKSECSVNEWDHLQCKRHF